MISAHARLRIELAAEHVIYHLAQCLDRLRLAAVVIGVAAMKRSIVKADWDNIRQADAHTKKGDPRYLDTDGTAGRAAQDVLLGVALNAANQGPADWLSWMLAQRNTNAHRAPQPTMALMVRKTGANLPVMTAPFVMQPSWTSVEAMGARQATKEDIGKLLLLDEPLEVLAGLLDCLSNVGHVTADSALSLWKARRADPSLLVQPGQQWSRTGDVPELTFGGFGNPLNLVPASEMRVHPTMARRLEAAKVLSGDKDFWKDADE